MELGKDKVEETVPFAALTTRVRSQEESLGLSILYIVRDK
jgi:hypothetical protein